MPYGMRVFCALLGGVLFAVGLALTVDRIISRGEVLEPNAAICGVGLGLLVAAAVRRD